MSGVNFIRGALGGFRDRRQQLLPVSMKLAEIQRILKPLAQLTLIMLGHFLPPHERRKPKPT